MRKILLPAVVALFLVTGLGVVNVAPATAATGVTITYPAKGRGAWSKVSMGGYYTIASRSQSAPGEVAVRAIRAGLPVSINDYAVHKGVLAIQYELRARGIRTADGAPIALNGVWTAKMDSAVRTFQASKGITPDGVVGPVTSRALFTQLVERAAAATDAEHRRAIVRIMAGTLTLESKWDPAAVGVRTPQDLGLGQINGPAHPGMSTSARLTPRRALPYVAGLIDSNLKAFDYRIDEGVAAYNLGKGGARRWVRAGKPRIWPVGTKNDIHAYIGKVLNPVR